MNIAEIEQELSAASHGTKKQIVNKYAQLHGISSDTIYRELRKRRGKVKTLQRESKIEQNLIDEVAKLKARGFDGISDRELSTELCIEILKSRGVEGAEDLTVSTVNRRLAESGFRLRKKIVRVEATYANEQHQLDFSRSKYFQIFKFENNDYLLKATSKTLFYKENENKLRTWLIGVTDAYSRVSLAKAVAASGESALIGIDFMNFAYCRDEDLHPMRYLPETLKTDNGSFIKNESVKSMLEKLEVGSELVEPYKKRGIQKRESAWKMIWKRFELKIYILLGEGKTISLTDYNDLLHEFMIELLEWKHPIKNETRGHVYRASLTAHPPRELKVDLKEVIARPWIRTIGDDCCISINNQKYETTNYKLIGQRVRAYKNLAGEVVAETIDEYCKPFVMRPTDGYVSLGDFEHRAPNTYLENIQNEIDKKSMTGTSVHPARTAPVPSDAGVVHYLKPAVKEVEVSTPFTEAVESEDYEFPSLYKAKLFIAEKLRADYEEYSDLFDPLLAGTLRRRDIERVINENKNIQQSFQSGLSADDQIEDIQLYGYLNVLRKDLLAEAINNQSEIIKEQADETVEEIPKAESKG